MPICRDKTMTAAWLKVPAAKPVDYWKDTSLRLAKGSTDEKYAKKTKRKATAPHNYVSDLQKDLIELGYLKTGADDGDYGTGTERAVKRFQRHALRKFRWNGTTKIGATPWVGTVTGICDAATAKEVRAWIDKKYRLAVGVYKLVKIDGGSDKREHFLREDAEKVWKEAIDEAAKLGATLLPSTGPRYGDTWRNPAGGFKFTGGNSKRSLHYTGRAVDVSQALPGGKGQRWWVAKEVIDQKTYWRAYCKTDQQDGTQGTKIDAKTKMYYLFYNHTEAWIPEGYYLDVTDFLKGKKFDRIPAHANYQTNPKGLEWWHFHYTEDLQETFLDEMELIGFTEQQLKTAGWTEADLDSKAG